MTIKAAAFDMDGLMFNTEDLFTDVAVALLEPYGKTFTPQVKSSITGLQPLQAIQTIIDHYQIDVTATALLAKSSAIADQVFTNRVKTMPGLLQLIAHIEAKNLPMALTTSSERSGVKRCMTSHDLSHHFAFMLTAEDITNGKPHPEIYLTAAAKFGVEPAEMLVLEDSPAGTRSATAAGAICVAVNQDNPADFAHANLHVTQLDDARVFGLIEQS